EDLGAAAVTGAGFSKSLSLAQGSHRLQVRAADPAGNWSADSFFDVFVDLTPPESSVQPMTSPTTSTVLDIVVSGADPDPGAGQGSSGIASYDVFVSVDQGVFTLWRTLPGDAPTAMFTAAPGHQYDFYSVAHDLAGNVETIPADADATVSVPELGLTCGPPLNGAAANVFVQCSGTVGVQAEVVEFEIAAPEFDLAGGVTRLGFHVTSSADWNPAEIVIQDGNGNPVASLFSSPDVAGGETSLVLAQLGYGSYTIHVAGEGAAFGDVVMSVFLAGDGDGNRIVELPDLLALRSLLGAHVGDSRYQVEWDADLDGDLDTADYLQCRYNLNDSLELFAPLMLAGLPASGDGGAAEVSETQIQQLLEVAVAEFAAAGVEASQLALLSQVSVHVADLRGGTLGLERGGAIWLDQNAAGHGWQVWQADGNEALVGDFARIQPSKPSPTPSMVDVDQQPAAGVDLLTVLGHELGHVLGWRDLSPDVDSDDLMTATLVPGERRIPGRDSGRLASEAVRPDRNGPQMARRHSTLDALFAEDLAPSSDEPQEMDALLEILSRSR
ncbi:MAG: hypothetical protein JJ992_26355, partial [Planctomycetes bacterium]|nr:hypothetical protein [Planctomycetota bacterium]